MWSSFVLGWLALITFGGTFVSDLLKAIFGAFGTATGMIALTMVLSAVGLGTLAT